MMYAIDPTPAGRISPLQVSMLIPFLQVEVLSNGLMQIRRVNGGRLTGIKAVLKATPEKISHSDRGGTRRTQVAHILSLSERGDINPFILTCASFEIRELT